MDWTNDINRWEVTKDDERPARLDGTCFYCAVPIGGRHKPDCVIPKKWVKVAVTIEIEMAYPIFQEKDSIEFHLNESSWCASNIMGYIEAVEQNGCLCGYASFKVLHIEEPDGQAQSSATN